MPGSLQHRTTFKNTKSTIVADDEANNTDIIQVKMFKRGTVNLLHSGSVLYQL